MAAAQALSTGRWMLCLARCCRSCSQSPRSTMCLQRQRGLKCSKAMLAMGSETAAGHPHACSGQQYQRYQRSPDHDEMLALLGQRQARWVAVCTQAVTARQTDGGLYVSRDCATPQKGWSCLPRQEGPAILPTWQHEPLEEIVGRHSAHCAAGGLQAGQYNTISECLATAGTV
jgi:hypothetical protein